MRPRTTPGMMLRTLNQKIAGDMSVRKSEITLKPRKIRAGIEVRKYFLKSAFSLFLASWYSLNVLIEFIVPPKNLNSITFVIISYNRKNVKYVEDKKRNDLDYLWLCNTLYGKIFVFFESISIYKEEEVEKKKRFVLLVVVFLFLIPLLSGCGKGVEEGVAIAPTADVSIETIGDLVYLPTQESSPEPTVEPTEILPIPTVEVYRGPLSLIQIESLASISLEYVANTNKEARVIAKSMGHDGAGMVCGPLSATMLSRVGVLEPEVDPYQFSYLNPRPDKDLWKLKKMMPEDKFEYFEFDSPVGSFDFSSFPLYPGDFLYLFAGDYGSFEHMMTVTRVDEMGRAYSVTNLIEVLDGKPTGGYIISEVMLYDPTVPDTGQFAVYNSPDYAKIGRTGYRFWVIRLK